MAKIITDLSEVDRQLEAAEYAWLELGDVSKIHTDDILHSCVQKDEIEAAYHFIKLTTQPEYLHLFVKEVMQIGDKPINLGIHQCVILQELWRHKFPMFIMSRGGGKTSLSAIYLLLRALLVPNTKVVITGAGFRQAKLPYEYIDTIWNSSPILRDICSTDSGSYISSDRCKFQINDSTITAIPLGNGEKIRGMRANIIFSDEFASIVPEIYEQVVQGFAAVAADPVEKMKAASRRQHFIDHGMWTEEQEEIYSKNRGNQSIIAGTCDYEFKHFAKYWKDYRSIILGQKTTDDNKKTLNPKDYCIIRYPYKLIPTGFMDDTTIARAKAVNSTSVYLMEYAAVFVKDSDGFFKRTLIEQCVCNPSSKIEKKCGLVVFDAKIHGDTSKKYIIAVDPASEKDNLAIVILELWEDHWRIVRCWTTNRKSHREKVERKTVTIENYYAYCARKIRDFMREYPTVKIGIDAQGGGNAIIEALHDPSIMDTNEQLIWEEKIQGDPKPTDNKEGVHIIQKVEFAKADWVAEANHGLKKDLEMRYCLFPRYDALSLTLAADEDLKTQHEDSIEDAIYEIEELKNELTTIVMSTTPSGRDRWDTPEQKTASGKKGRMRKDRYSALVIANMIARTISRAEPAIKYSFVGGLVSELAQRKDTEPSRNSWYKQPLDSFKSIRRG